MGHIPGITHNLEEFKPINFKHYTTTVQIATFESGPDLCQAKLRLICTTQDKNTKTRRNVEYNVWMSGLLNSLFRIKSRFIPVGAMVSRVTIQ